jgi:hypothetical protein
MYSRQESARTKKEFWTVLGKYLTPMLSSEEERVNWMNYKTGEKDIYFRMNVDTKKASICIELTHKDPGIQEIYFRHFLSLKSIFEEFAGKWNWEPLKLNDNGQQISKIYLDKTGLNILNREDWPELISFFKANLIALDKFWNSVKYSFESLK